MTDETPGDERSRTDGAASASLELSVPEMDCPSCAGKVDSSLGGVAGVTETDLHPTTGTATVTYDPTRTSGADVVAAVEGAGYDVAGTSDDGGGDDAVEVAPPSEVWTSPRALKTWAGAVALVAGLAVEFLLGADPVLATVLGAVVTLSDALLLAAVGVSGYPVVRGGYYSARNLSLDIDLLMGTAILAASAIGFFVEAATLAVLFSVAELLEDYAMDRARDSLRELLELSPDEATVLREAGTSESDRTDDETGEETEAVVPADDVAVGETVVVRPGEKIPLDGVVVDGDSAVDESPITGESVPVDKAPGDEVYAGSITEEGYLEVEVTSTAGDSTLARVIELVQGAQAERTETERFVDRFASYYTPVVVALAILTAALGPLVVTDPVTVELGGLTHTVTGDPGTWFVRGLTLLVIACPCAFVISTPVSVVSGITSAAKNGVLIKGGTHLETMGAVDAVALDKTGTLTKGELAVTDVVGVAADERTVLSYAAALEARSEHPIARAVLDHADEAGVDAPEPENFETLTGKGVRADVDGETCYAGKPALFADLGVDPGRRATDGGAVADPDPPSDSAGDGGSAPTDLGETLAALERAGKTVVLVGTADTVLGVVAVADEVRPASARAVERLRALGVAHVVMLTGDNEGTARAIADEVGVDDYRAELLPEQKVDAVGSLQEAWGTVAMVGDGINDAPALASADVGVAMGAAGTDTALETADVALMGDDVAKLPYLYALSNEATDVIRQNVWASLAVKALLAVGVPLGLVSVALAVVVGDMGMSLGVTGNAMRLSRLRPDSFD